ncbi:non-hydrolyzing UDP-N-acetylglucosamine 2-epimerase [Desulfobacter postgatei]|jgi:UDP-N-acetylglucosamine 2-epimerase (non-hydrolysing)|uniref:non-hydrolyzing UDP-N-acetylglucosamine 2-epimerase n=1 Tax=Desulfobacter postgatei TaxID=2293 RepID=UPI002A35ECA9|nr:UDP-N-acetylglucosamine 2-epimerase (non-hydrolyzing) [Desulfobacter postgatei]MDX9964222.1 UDP-N-acetylglucosamine 2-epimerase (non-hydrolyzing) [Desulfobacter postgatei]
MRVLVVFGTRPEAIKLIPVIQELKKHAPKVETVVCVTSQHREMLDQVLDIFSIKPDHDLDLMQKNQDLASLTATILDNLTGLIRKVQPDWVLVQGDTTTTFTAALAAYYCKVKVAHIEAGLRTGNKYSPFPEEINRCLTGRITDLHFPPTGVSRDNLLKEGIDPDSVWVTGNTVVDALQQIANRLAEENTYKKQFEFIEPDRKIILVTGHRRESFGSNLENICLALKKIAGENNSIQVIYPVHLNPSVWEPVHKILGESKHIHLIYPLDYLAFVYLMSISDLIITDSGGVQEEAPSLGKYVLITRNTTERPEGIEAGVAELVGADTGLIASASKRILNNNTLTPDEIRDKSPYGDGQASSRIVEVLLSGRCNEFM